MISLIKPCFLIEVSSSISKTQKCKCILSDDIHAYEANYFFMIVISRARFVITSIETVLRKRLLESIVFKGHSTYILVGDGARLFWDWLRSRRTRTR